MFEWLQKIPLSSILLGLLCCCLFFLLIWQSVSFRKKKQQLRKDAAKRSRAVRDGQMAEQIAPYLPDFPCRPEDARFIGKPFDFIAFPGLEENNQVDEILLIEVKTGSSSLTAREKEVMRAVKEGRVKYIQYRIEN